MVATAAMSDARPKIVSLGGALVHKQAHKLITMRCMVSQDFSDNQRVCLMLLNLISTSVEYCIPLHADDTLGFFR